MALSNRINFRGGQSAPLGNYLYKDGVDNISVTGGLTGIGYTLINNASYSKSGTLSFDSDNIRVTSNSTWGNYEIFGASLPIDVTNINTLYFKYIENGVVKTATVDVRNATGNRYVFASVYRSSTYTVIFGLATNKSDCITTAQGYETHYDTSVNTIYVKEIQIA